MTNSRKIKRFIAGKMKKLNLGSGNDIKKGYVNLDYIKAKGVDKVHDLNKTPYPFKSNTFEEIYASHVLEHLDGDWFKILNELHRILKKNGILYVEVPHFTSAIAFIENHRRFFRYRSFEDFQEQKTLRALDQITGNNFKILNRKIKFNKFPLIYNLPVEWFVNQSKSSAIIYENTFIRSLFPAEELTFTLKKI
jgi:SAM-dependent methyltransferase